MCTPYVSDFHALKTAAGETVFYCKLWILAYDGGFLTSWNYSDIYDNYILMSEIGVYGVIVSQYVYVDSQHLPHVFKSCNDRQSEQALHKKSL